MANVNVELLVLISMQGALLAALTLALRLSVRANGELSKTLIGFGETLQAHNREREAWGREREALRNELEALRYDAGKRQERLEKEIDQLKAELERERQQRQALEAQVRALRTELEHERSQRQKLEIALTQAEHDKAELAAERDVIYQQLESLRAALESKADKRGSRNQKPEGKCDGTDNRAVDASRDSSRHVADGPGDAGSKPVVEQTGGEPGSAAVAAGESTTEQHPDAD